jgi:tetratricopeptide (TPR) repeat protein
MLADLLSNESFALSKAARHADALASYEASVELRERSGGDIRESACRLASIYGSLGRLDESGAAFDTCYQALRERLGNDHPGLMESLNGRAIVELQQGHFASGEQLLRSAISIGNRALGHDHPSLATMYTNLGHALREQGRSTEALRAFNHALLLHRRARGEHDPFAAAFISNAGLIAYDERRWRDADAAFEEALRIFNGAKRPDAYAFYIGVIETQLGDSLLAQGKAKEAQHRYQSALAHIESSVGTDHPQLVLTLTGLGRSELALGAVASARRVLARAVEIGKAGSGSPFDLAAAQFAWARAETAAGIPKAQLREVVLKAEAALNTAGRSTRPVLRDIERWLSPP